MLVPADDNRCRCSRSHRARCAIEWVLVFDGEVSEAHWRPQILIAVDARVLVGPVVLPNGRCYSTEKALEVYRHPQIIMFADVRVLTDPTALSNGCWLLGRSVRNEVQDQSFVQAGAVGN